VSFSLFISVFPEIWLPANRDFDLFFKISPLPCRPFPSFSTLCLSCLFCWFLLLRLFRVLFLNSEFSVKKRKRKRNRTLSESDVYERYHWEKYLHLKTFGLQKLYRKGETMECTKKEMKQEYFGDTLTFSSSPSKHWPHRLEEPMTWKYSTSWSTLQRAHASVERRALQDHR